MINNGTQWKGLLNYKSTLNPDGVFLTSEEPTKQSRGGNLVDGDLWIDTANSEKYPTIYRYSDGEWVIIDLTDQTSPFGIVFADARPNAGPDYNGSTHKAFSEETTDLLVSDYVDPDTPDPRAYPAGMLLFNTRYSTRNVKSYQPTYFEKLQEPTYTVGNSPEFVSPGYNGNTAIDRWVNASGNELDGSPYMGRHAQRIMIVRAMASTIISNADIRAEDVEFNLLAAPGYVELYDELITLNTDRKETAYIITDVPPRLKPNATDILAWVNNSNNAASNGELGLTSRYTYSCVCYPWGLGTNLDGYEVAIPSSAIKLRQIATSDITTGGCVWKPAAGVRRGIVTNAASIGYITDENEYQPVKLNEGLRDVLFDNGINPIRNIPSYGLTIWGDKTLAGTTSLLDSEGVARMIVMIRSDLQKMSIPYFYELNTPTLRASFKAQIDGYLTGIMQKEGLEDFVVVCDNSNNTAARVHAYELWCDIAILPNNSIRWIYIPIRVVNDSSKL